MRGIFAPLDAVLRQVIDQPLPEVDEVGLVPVLLHEVPAVIDHGFGDGLVPERNDGDGLC